MKTTGRPSGLGRGGYRQISSDLGCRLQGEVIIMKQRTIPQMHACLAVASLLGGCASIGGRMQGPLVIASQGSFFVGGRDVYSETLSTLPAFPPNGTITVDQMYVHYQI